MLKSLELKALCHLGFTVVDIDQFFDTWGQVLGCTERHVHTEGAPGGILVGGEDPGELEVSVAFTRVAGLPIELIQTHKGRTCHSDWLESHGPGLHHVAFWVDDLPKQIETCISNGMDLLMAPSSLGQAVLGGSANRHAEIIKDDPATQMLAVPEIFAFFGMPAANEQWTLELLDARFIDQYKELNGELPGYPD